MYLRASISHLSLSLSLSLHARSGDLEPGLDSQNFKLLPWPQFFDLGLDILGACSGHVAWSCDKGNYNNLKTKPLLWKEMLQDLKIRPRAPEPVMTKKYQNFKLLSWPQFFELGLALEDGYSRQCRPHAKPVGCGGSVQTSEIPQVRILGFKNSKSFKRPRDIYIYVI